MENILQIYINENCGNERAIPCTLPVMKANILITYI